MRLFIAIEPDDAARRTLTAFREELRKRVSGRFVRDEQLHLTLLFLGEMPEKSLPGICETLTDATTAHTHIPLSLGLPDVFRAGIYVHVNGDLEPLHRTLTKAMLPHGIEPDKRPFLPHITIAREAKAPDSWPALSPIAWNCGEIILYESRLNGRREYIPVHRVKLQP